ncbi:MAG: hypothetical protein WD272_09035 [Balneolales bacterium]
MFYFRYFVLILIIGWLLLLYLRPSENFVEPATGSMNEQNATTGNSVVPDNRISDEPKSIFVFSDTLLQVNRGQDTLFISGKNMLYPGDIIQTGSRQFASVVFPTNSLLIIYPASRLAIEPRPGVVTLESADIRFEKGRSPSIFPDTIQCYHARLILHNNHTEHADIGIQCRGESGVSVSSQRGYFTWKSNNTTYPLTPGSALTGRVTSSSYQWAEIPERPHLIDTIKADAIHVNIVAVEDSVPLFRTKWESLPMADQYLLHIERKHSSFHWHYTNMHTNHTLYIPRPDPGTYTFRISAIDYYGIMGRWSESIDFVVQSDTTFILPSEKPLE